MRNDTPETHAHKESQIKGKKLQSLKQRSKIVEAQSRRAHSLRCVCVRERQTDRWEIRLQSENNSEGIPNAEENQSDKQANKPTNKQKTDKHQMTKDNYPQNKTLQMQKTHLTCMYIQGCKRESIHFPQETQDVYHIHFIREREKVTLFVPAIPRNVLAMGF